MKLSKSVLVFLFCIVAAACGKKSVNNETGTATVGTPIVTNPYYPTTPTNLSGTCSQNGGQVYGSVCAISRAYYPSSGLYYDWGTPPALAYINAGEGVITQGSGSVTLSLNGSSIGLNNRTAASSSGNLTIDRDGNHNIQVWVVRCYNNSNMHYVSCVGNL